MTENMNSNMAADVTLSERNAQLDEELRKEKADHVEEVQVLKEEVKVLKDLVEKITRKYKEALEEIARLNSLLNNNSSNTSLPPSTDRNKTGKPVNHYNGRSKSEKKVGGQTGHKGRTLTKEEAVKRIASGKYKHVVQDLGDKNNEQYITKYELDLEITPVIREIRIHANAEGKIEIPERYNSDVTYGDTVKSLVTHLYGCGVMSNDRIASFINEASGGDFALSDGSVYNFCAQFADKAEKTIAELEREQSVESVLCTDATNTTTNGKKSYIRNFSSKSAVIYYAMESKAIEALKNIEFLVGYHGILMHDHERALYHFGKGHAECNVHILRYLRKNTEDTGNEWSEKMITVLTKANKARKALIAAGKSAFEEKEVQEYENQYKQYLGEGREQNQKTEHEFAKKRETTLLNRMEKYSENHLLFLHRFDVPFDDNMSERDLRKAKNRQKMTGGFRKHSGLEMYCKILTIIETAKRKQVGIIDTIKNIFSGTSAVFQAV